MIYTVTLNTAIDYYMTVGSLNIGGLNRADSTKLCFGGKGINVSLRLKEMGVNSVVTGFIGGFTGAALEQYIRSVGIDTELIEVQNGATRINVKLSEREETELNGVGYSVNAAEYSRLKSVLSRASGDSDDIVVLSGSVPRGLDKGVYSDICAKMAEIGVKTAVDTSGEALLDTLKYKPLVIKPNISELSELFGKELTELAEIEKYARRLREIGAENVLVSMGGNGAALLEGEDFYYTQAAEGKVVSTVGCGDCMLAAYLAYRDRLGGKALLDKCVELSGKYAFTVR
jgi:1-phosphofructokinase